MTQSQLVPFLRRTEDAPETVLSEQAVQGLMLAAHALPHKVGNAANPIEAALHVQSLAATLSVLVDHSQAVCADARRQRDQQDMLVNMLRCDVAQRQTLLELERRARHRTTGALIAVVVMVVLYGVLL